jgi:hypothetical protein
LTPEHCQEALSRAYIQAVAAQCGMLYSTPVPDYGIDMTLHQVKRLQGGRYYQTGVKVDLQIKSTTRPVYRNNSLMYELSVRNYDDLRNEQPGTPRILVVLVIHDEVGANWVVLRAIDSIFRCCGYWVSLRGRPETSNRRTIQVELPLTQVFNAAALRDDIVQRIENGGYP